MQLLQAEGGFKSILVNLIGEKPIKEYEACIQGGQLSNRVKKVLLKIVKKINMTFTRPSL